MALFIFFYVIHPCIIFDTDDWRYLAHARKAWPDSSQWNPARVFPELLMPMVSMFGTFVIHPLTGMTYTMSWALAYALAISVVITGYVCAMAKLIRSQTQIGTTRTCIISLLFLLFHFLVLRISHTDNDYLFGSHNVTTMFYYTIPALLNAYLVMKWELSDRETKYDTAESMFTVLAVYLAVFSNLYTSIILCSYAAVCFIQNAFRNRKRDNKRGNFVQDNTKYLVVVGLFFVSCLFEMGGGRADSVRSERGLFSEMWQTVKNLLHILKNLNRVYYAGSVLLMLTAGACFLIRKDTREERLVQGLLKFAASGMITASWLILLCAITGTDRIMRGDVLLGLFFYVFIAETYAIAYLAGQLHVMSVILPLLLLITFFEINTEGRTFRERNLWNLSPRTCFDIAEDIIGQLREADESGMESVQLTVLKADTKSNWPHADWGTQLFPGALYKHGIIKHNITVILNPSEEFNEKYDAWQY